MIYFIQGGNPNDCPTFPFCEGNLACNSGKCPEPGASIDAGIPIMIGLALLLILTFKRWKQN